MAILATHILLLLPLAISSLQQITAVPVHARQAKGDSECTQAATQTFQSFSDAVQMVDKLAGGDQINDPAAASALKEAQTGLNDAKDGMKALATSIQQQQAPSQAAQTQISRGLSTAQTALQSVHSDNQTISAAVQQALDQLNSVSTNGSKAISACGLGGAASNSASTGTAHNSTSTGTGQTGGNSTSTGAGQTGGNSTSTSAGETGSNSTSTGSSQTGQPDSGSEQTGDETSFVHCHDRHRPSGAGGNSSLCDELDKLFDGAQGDRRRKDLNQIGLVGGRTKSLSGLVNDVTGSLGLGHLLVGNYLA